MTERWLPVVGWEGFYEVSDLGRVRSLPRTHPNPLTGGVSITKGKILSTTANQRYVRITLYPGSVTKSVHRLVAEAFLGPPPEGKNQVLHWDDDGTNNRLDNLRWGTGSENNKDATRNGNSVNANKTHCPKGHEYTEENTYVAVKLNTTSRICRECLREHDRRRDGSPLSGPEDPRHGTMSGYGRHKCRCSECREAHRVYQKAKRARKRAESSRNPS